MKTIQTPELISSMSQLFPEREEVIRGMCISVLAKEHAVLIGEPGTAKSLVIRTLAACLDKSYFEVLMHAFSTPEEFFGPIALSGLQNDKYIRATKGYAPECEIINMEEVFKSNAGMLNALLALLNERKFHNDGKVLSAPLVSCFGSSNELPEGPQLSALYDRFMMRFTVGYIADKDAFARMLTAGPVVLPGVVDLATEQGATAEVSVTSDTVAAVVALRGAYTAAGMRASDRRWRQSLGLVKATAHIAGRKNTEPEDLEVMEHVLWNKPDEKVQVSKIVQAVISPDGSRAVAELDSARDLFRRIPDPSKTDPGIFMGAIGQATQDLTGIVKRLQAIPKGRKVDKALKEVLELKAKAAQMAMRAAGIDL